MADKREELEDEEHENGENRERDDNNNNNDDDDDGDNQIVGIGIQHLQIQMIVDMIYKDLKRNYYVSIDWSEEFYITQAIRGFIAVTYSEYLLPEIQKTYCIIPFFEKKNDIDNIDYVLFQKNKKVIRKFHQVCARNGSESSESGQRQYIFRINYDFEGVLKALNDYHSNSWLTPQYQSLMTALHRRGEIKFYLDRVEYKLQVCCVAVYDSKDNSIVCGEVGYAIGGVFTSIAGFLSKKVERCSIGLIQILALLAVMRQHGFVLLNLGHPPGTSMKYKAEIGGVVVRRDEFLQKYWLPATKNSTDIDKNFFSLEVDDVSTLLPRKNKSDS